MLSFLFTMACSLLTQVLIPISFSRKLSMKTRIKNRINWTCNSKWIGKKIERNAIYNYFYERKKSCRASRLLTFKWQLIIHRYNMYIFFRKIFSLYICIHCNRGNHIAIVSINWQDTPFEEKIFHRERDNWGLYIQCTYSDDTRENVWLNWYLNLNDGTRATNSPSGVN